MIAAGTIIDQRYEIISLLGKGGMCAVYKVRHLELQREVALKILHRKLITDSHALERFRREAVAVNKLEDPHIIRVYGFGIYDQAPYMAMECIDGISLAQHLTAQGRLPLDQALPIFEQILSALEKAHAERIIHRDLKPSNVMLVGPYRIVKVLDFGIAKILPDTGNQLQKLTQTGELFGTTIYMSPEQCRGEALDARSDIYSMGCLMYETLDGSPPIYGDTPFSTLNKHLTALPRESEFVTGPVGTVINACLAKSPDRRPSSASELKQALSNPEVWIQARPATSSSVSCLLHWPWPQIAIGVGAAAIAVLCVVAYLRAKRVDDPNILASMSERSFREGETLFENGQSHAAVEKLNQAISQDPKSAPVYYYRGCVLETIGEKSAAVKDFTMVLQLGNPPTTRYRKWDPSRRRAANLRILGKFDDSLADYNCAIRLAQKEVELYEERALLYMEMHRPADALTDLKTAEKCGANNAALYEYLARAQSAAGRHKQACDDLTIAINRFLAQYERYGYTKGDRKSIDIVSHLNDDYALRAGEARMLGRLDQAKSDAAQAKKFLELR